MRSVASDANCKKYYSPNVIKIKILFSKFGYTTGMSELRSAPMNVFIDHVTADGLTVASIEWADMQHSSDPPYTVAIPDSEASLALDPNFAVRPWSITMYDTGADQSAEALTHYIGKELTEALLQARRVGISTLSNVSLSPDSRFHIAELQATSPSTPPSVRRAAQTMLIEHAASAQRPAAQPIIPRQRGSRPSPFGRLGVAR